MMPSFTPLNVSDSYLVEELNIHNIDNEMIKDAFKNAFLFTNSLGPLPKE